MAQGAEKRASRRSASAAEAKAGQNGRTEEADGASVNMTDLEYVRGLIEAVDHSGIDRLEIARAGTRIRIAKTPAPIPGAAYMQMAPPMLPQSAAAPATAALPAAAAAAPQSQPAAEPQSAAAPSNLLDVKSPMVGTFYRGPAPEAPPYVEVGTSVTKGQTLCILEAMKLMNELESELEGIVREVLVDDADPVEYGQVLFRVEPAGSK